MCRQGALKYCSLFSVKFSVHAFLATHDTHTNTVFVFSTSNHSGMYVHHKRVARFVFTLLSNTMWAEGIVNTLEIQSDTSVYLL